MCDKCGDTGELLTVNDHGDSTYVPCNCDAGQELAELEADDAYLDHLWAVHHFEDERCAEAEETAYDAMGDQLDAELEADDAYQAFQQEIAQQEAELRELAGAWDIGVETHTGK